MLENLLKGRWGRAFLRWIILLVACLFKSLDDTRLPENSFNLWVAMRPTERAERKDSARREISKSTKYP